MKVYSNIFSSKKRKKDIFNIFIHNVKLMKENKIKKFNGFIFVY